jgi:N-sulfoglucosamine sulfohydrolase
MIRLLPLLALCVAARPARPAQEAARPNILWISVEDITPNVRCFGDAYAVTPTIDRLATQGIRYMNAFAPIGVCAPSRSTLIMGTFAPSVGTQHMRCKGTLPDYIHCFPEYLRDAGYYCSNNEKTDYNFVHRKESWDESSKKAHWRNRKPGQPFFSVFNNLTSHESQIRIPEAQYRKRTEKFTAEERHDPAKAPIPPYHPDTPEVRQDWARYADMITLMDRETAAILKELDDDGLAENTIVFFFSDHGAGMPRSKRWLYESSLKVPLVVRFPEKWKRFAPGATGSTTDRLVSFVDFGPTVLSLANVKIPAHMQGKPFLGDAAVAPREFVHGFRDRMDERYDLLRSVRDARWHYLRNYMPHRPWAQHIAYMYEMPTMKAWQRLHDEGKLNEVQDRFFQKKPLEELYDTQADPWEIRNLADDPAHRATLECLRGELRRWQLEIVDLGFLPEYELRTRFGVKAPHEAVRADPKGYPLERLMEAADLANRGDPKVFELLNDGDAAVRFWGATGCIALGEKARPALDALLKLLGDPAPNVQFAAAEALCALGRADDAIPVLARGLKHESEWVRLPAALGLEPLAAKNEAVRAAFKELSGEKTEYVKRIVENALK